MYPEDTLSPPICVASVLAFVLLAVTLQADDELPANPVPFEAEVQGIFQTKCVRCHNSQKAEAGLDLSTPAGILHGSESGRVIHAGAPQDSLLFEKVSASEMRPDEQDRLTADEVASIQKWITAGATFRESVVAAPEITQDDIIPLLYLRCAPCHGGRRRA